MNSSIGYDRRGKNITPNGKKWKELKIKDTTFRYEISKLDTDIFSSEYEKISTHQSLRYYIYSFRYDRRGGKKCDNKWKNG